MAVAKLIITKAGSEEKLALSFTTRRALEDAYTHLNAAGYRVTGSWVEAISTYPDGLSALAEANSFFRKL